MCYIELYLTRYIILIRGATAGWVKKVLLCQTIGGHPLSTCSGAYTRCQMIDQVWWLDVIRDINIAYRFDQDFWTSNRICYDRKWSINTLNKTINFTLLFSVSVLDKFKWLNKEQLWWKWLQWFECCVGDHQSLSKWSSPVRLPLSRSVYRDRNLSLKKRGFYSFSVFIGATHSFDYMGCYFRLCAFNLVV